MLQAESFAVEIIKKIDNPVYLVAIVLIAFFGFIFKDNILKAIKEGVIAKNKPTESKILSLLNHDVFPTMTRVANQVNMMKFYTDQKFDETKSRMCHDFTRHKTEQCAIRMQAVIEREDIDYIPKNALKNYVFHEQTYMHELYVNAVKQEWYEKGVQQKDIDYVIQLFESFRYDVVVSFENRINAIFSNSAYDSNYKLLLAVFEMWAMGIDLLPKDMQTTFEALNGRFKNLKYDL